MDIRYIAIALSSLLSLLVINANPLLNDDAFKYLKAAELFNADGMNAVIDVYGWYGYSIAIALLDTLLPTNLVNSAHLLNMLLYGILVYAFISLVMEYRDNPTSGLFAATVILLYPNFNELRFLLIRDVGFWAFSVTGLLQLIRYHRHNRILHAAGWTAAMLAAVFFRLEGLILIAIAPLALLVSEQPFGVRVRRLLALLGILLVGIVTVLVLTRLMGINLFDVFNFAYRWYLPLIYDYGNTVTAAAQGLEGASDPTGGTPEYSGRGLPVLLLGWCYSVISNLAGTLGTIYTLLLAAGLLVWRHSLPREARTCLLSSLGASLLSLLIFVSIMHFLTQRYAVLAAILLLSVLAVHIDRWYQQARENRQLPRFRMAFAGLAFLLLVDGLVSFGYSKQYIEDAIAWAANNVASGTTFHTNDAAIAFYSGLVPDYDLVRPDPLESLSSLQAGDTLALVLAHDEVETRQILENQSALHTLEVFANTRGDEVRFYRFQP